MIIYRYWIVIYHSIYIKSKKYFFYMSSILFWKSSKVLIFVRSYFNGSSFSNLPMSSVIAAMFLVVIAWYPMLLFFDNFKELIDLLLDTLELGSGLIVFMLSKLFIFFALRYFSLFKDANFSINFILFIFILFSFRK